MAPRMMNGKVRYIARLPEVTVTRDGDFARIEFGKLLTTYEGWGMRIEFVPQEEVHRRPVVEIREPTEK
jgi:hypothetical protein